MNIKHLFESLLNRQNLTAKAMKEVIHACMRDELSDAQIAAFLALMRMKGETPEELTAAALTLLEFSHAFTLTQDAIDIVGTGGDGSNTFNVSTAAAFVVAGAGIPVAKHGNRSFSSKSGSADLLEQAGFNLNLNASQHQQCLDECGITFIFAQHFHPALQKVKAARQQLGIRTLFNLIGPLLNPAKVQKQVLGVYSPSWAMPLAQVLKNLGRTRFLVINSEDGLDEFSLRAPTHVIECKNGQFETWIFDPEELGIKSDSMDKLVINSPAESLTIIKNVLAGASGPCRDIVVLNAAAAIYCAKDNVSFTEAYQQAAKSINTKAAENCFNQLLALTQSFL